MNKELMNELQALHQKVADLEKSKEKYRIISDFAYDWTYWIDPHGKYIYISPSTKRITGYSPEEILRDPDLILNLIHPEDREITKKHLVKDLQDTTNIYQIDFRIINRNGDVLWISHNCQPVFDKDGNFRGRRASNRDISNRKKMEQTLRQTTDTIRKLNKELEQRITELTEVNKELDAFTYSVSHDLKMPLTIIGGFTRRLQKAYRNTLASDGQEKIEIIQMQVRKMETLIQDLLSYSRSSRQKITLIEVNMGELIKTVLEEFKQVINGRKIRFHIKKIPPAYGDTNLIKQVLINLISNAVKFSSAKKSAVINIGCKIDTDKNIYYVKDNGIGFNPKDTDKLFLPFHRLSNTNEIEGTGIGLSIVSRIIKRHHGRVWAEGKTNKGATFYFSLPNKEI